MISREEAFLTSKKYNRNSFHTQHTLAVEAKGDTHEIYPYQRHDQRRKRSDHPCIP